MDEQVVGLNLQGVVRRRTRLFLLVAIPVLAGALGTAFLLPPVYLSKATILVEDQQIPEEYVKSTITGYVEERLQIITQQIMSRTKLQEIVKQFQLYPELQQRNSMEEIVDKLREAVKLKTISAEAKGRGGRSGAATIAFSVSYEGRDPLTVQRVRSRSRRGSW